MKYNSSGGPRQCASVFRKLYGAGTRAGLHKARRRFRLKLCAADVTDICRGPQEKHADKMQMSEDTPNKLTRSVHITNYYHSLSGGVKTNYDRLLKAANERQRYVSLIVPDEAASVENVGDHAKIYRIAAPPSRFIDKRYRTILPTHYLQTGTPVRTVLLAEMPQMIEVYDNASVVPFAAVVRKGFFSRLGRPMLVYFTGERFDTIFKTFVIGGRIGAAVSRNLMGNFILQMFDYFIANSEFVAEEIYTATEKYARANYRIHNSLGKFFKTLPETVRERVRICPRGVDTELFSPANRSEAFRSEIIAKAGLPKDAKIMLSSTRLSTEKNVELLPHIMHHAARSADNKFFLLIAGDGPRKDDLKAAAEKLCPGRVVFVGHIDKPTLARYYANADVFIHPNPREPFGNVGLEAMASGTAILAPNSGGILTYADKDNAWLVEPTAESFAAALAEIADSGSERLRRIDNGLAAAAQNSQANSMSRLFATYDELYADFRARGLTNPRQKG